MEIRKLLSAGVPTGTWVGQDRHDLVGRSSRPGPNGVQDVRIALADLPIGQAVTRAEVGGHGGGLWAYNGTGTHWAAAFVRAPGATTADLYFEPAWVEVGREFSVRLWFDDGSTTLVYFAGGAADPALRMPEAVARPTWIGQDGSDRVGPGPSVGPDGRQDATIALANLTANVEIARVDVRGPGGLAWQSHTNAQGLPNAELIRNPADPSTAILSIQPDLDLAGLPLTLTLYYANSTTDTIDVLAGPTDPTLRVSAPTAVPLRADAIAARWLGQADDPAAGLGAVGVALEGLPAGRSVVGGSLSGSDRAVTWSYKASAVSTVSVEPFSRPLTFRRDPVDPTRASIAFPPEGDEQGTTLTLRLNYDDGTFSLVRFEGGPSDSALRSPRPAASHAVARPGDDLQALVDAHGSVRLSAGVYELDRPLVLNRAVAITAEPGATLRFAQPGTAPAWPSAITIHHGNTTLDGFAVRFAGPVRWDWSVPYEPAAIATTDTRDKVTGTARVGIVLSNLDLEGPPVAATGGPLERSAGLVNFVSAEDGRIVGNRLRGGSVKAFGGPWELSGNLYLGAMPGTWAYDVFAMSYVHDVDVRGNVASPLAGSGKTYRFLVMTQSGSDIRVEGNRVEGLGPRDDDAQPHPNTPEVILTEAYRVNFEGAPRALSADGSILQVPAPQGEGFQSGDLVAVLSGPLAGQWRRVAQVIDPRTLLLDRPLPTDQPIGDVSISSGFQGLTIADNLVDVRGGSQASPLVLGGAHFDVVVRNNRFLGGADVRLAASASERTVHWGWTHTPQFDVRFSNNSLEDSQGGLDAGLERYPFAKSSRGRTYVNAEIRDNLFSWSPSYFQKAGTTTAPTAMRLGDPYSIDPLEARLTVAGNLAKLPPGMAAGRGIDAVQLIYNGTAVAAATFDLAPQPLPAPTGLRLLADTGLSPADGLTADARLAFDRPAWAVGFEYRVAGRDGRLPLASPDGFLPAGLADGPVTVLVRALDDFGRPGPEASLTFTLDTAVPAPVSPTLGAGQDTGRSDSDRLTRIASPMLVAGGEATDTLVLVLLADGRELARRLGPGELRVGAPLADGTHQLAVRRIDAAGNSSIGAATALTIDATPPPAVAARLGPGQDTGISVTDNLTRLTAPTFQAVIDNSDALVLLRDGQEVDRITGTGTLRSGGPLADGTYRFAVRRIDAAGNATDGPALPVTIDATPPVPVSGLSRDATGLFRFERSADAVEYLYRVGNGPTAPTVGATSFRARGVPFEPTPVTVRAIDAAGNTGSEATILAATPMPVGSWIGQRPGVDLVGRQAGAAVPDGIQDVGLALTGLPTDRTIASAEVFGWGSGIWQDNIPNGPHWRAKVIQAPGTDRAEVYVQPYQYETGRSYFVRLNFSDGTTVGVTIAGGPVDPTLPTTPPPSPLSGAAAPSGSSAPGSTLTTDPVAGPIATPATPAPVDTPTPDPASIPRPRVPPPSASPDVVPSPGAAQSPTPPARPQTWRERMAVIRAARRERLARLRAMQRERARQQAMSPARRLAARSVIATPVPGGPRTSATPSGPR